MLPQSLEDGGFDGASSIMIHSMPVFKFKTLHTTMKAPRSSKPSKKKKRQLVALYNHSEALQNAARTIRLQEVDLRRRRIRWKTIVVPVDNPPTHDHNVGNPECSESACGQTENSAGAMQGTSTSPLCRDTDAAPSASSSTARPISPPNVTPTSQDLEIKKAWLAETKQYWERGGREQ